MLSTVQNRKEHPAIRNSGLFFDLKRSKKRTTFLENQVELDKSSYTTPHLSLSLFRLIYAPIYLLLLVSCNVLLVCSFNVILIEERDM